MATSSISGMTSRIDVPYLCGVGSECLAVLSKHFTPEGTGALESNLRQGFSNLSPANADYCLGRFVDAECDFRSVGNRGLGRLTDHVPRLGGHLRHTLSQLHESKLSTLSALVLKLATKCYVFQAIVSESPLNPPLISQSETLFEEWIPGIFSYDLSQASETFKGLLSAVTEAETTSIGTLLQENLDRRELLDTETLDGILLGYMAAGLTLRLTEAHRRTA